ncbi:MAG: hypothetical protein LUE10_00690 [Alistipes sp.]|nr:hypothetical protein [Alistipes sp.]
MKDKREDSLEREADRIQQQIKENEGFFRDDPDGDVLVDEDPEAPSGMFGDHQDDFDIG